MPLMHMVENKLFHFLMFYLALKFIVVIMCIICIILVIFIICVIETILLIIAIIVIILIIFGRPVGIRWLSGGIRA